MYRLTDERRDERSTDGLRRLNDAARSTDRVFSTLNYHTMWCLRHMYSDSALRFPMCPDGIQVRFLLITSITWPKNPAASLAMLLEIPVSLLQSLPSVRRPGFIQLGNIESAFREIHHVQAHCFGFHPLSW